MAAMTASVNPDLQNERNKATFDPIQLTYLLHNGPQQTRRKRYIQSLALNDRVKQNFRTWTELSREERYEESMKKCIYCADRVKELGFKDPVDIYIYNQMFTGHENSPFGLHNSMFTDVLTQQGTEEQKAKWLPLAKNYQILGTYAQTEMGHGTFVRGLETTATYDPKTQEFVLNSPTLTSIKYWPGALGKTSNHCIVIAQLYTQGHCHGLQPFIVPLRNLDNYQPLPGVEVGDIGLKFGYDAVDNGYLRLSNIRIPRENMLMRYSKVTEDGVFIKPKNDKLLYGGMVMIRSFITGDCGRGLSQACTIAIRYSSVRHQTEVTPGKGEEKILDYQTQQYKLFPALSTALAYLFAGNAIREMYLRVMADINKGALGELPQLHALSSGLKACSSYAASEMIETCRMACGGHGYSQASGFPKIYVNVTPACTYEGENTVLLLQTARYLMKCLNSSAQGEELPTLMSYLNKSTGGKTSTITDRLSLRSLVEAFEHRAARLIRECGSRIQTLTSRGMKPDVALNSTSVQLVKAATAHVECCVVKIFVNEVERKDVNPQLKPVLQAMCQLYTVYLLLQNSGEFMQDGFVTGQQVEVLNSKLLDLLSEIRPNAVAIVDGFDIPDAMLASALGRFDGQVYEALYQYARNSKLNKTEVSDAYYKHLKPFLDRQRQISTPSVVTSRL
ncbi:peroxisomal acyl-coenzyme A oxidase 1 [Patella vulgata]|uniref:peroxisomal acyl-coenzyme A oxidase 1 n=1 Tax=Patella vulgata TaxID=6465 RepID=UPI00217F3DD4|nr:peroxisomal acyl-coenzyme A oxidase 1 [Patella vulgata]